MRRRYSKEDIAIDWINGVLLVLIALVCIYPFWYVFAVSLNDNAVSSYANVVLVPRQWTLQNYQMVFRSRMLLNGYKISVIRTLIGTTLSVIFSGGMGFALSQKQLIGRRLFNILLLIPMYIGGGLIANYIWIKNLGMLDTFAVLILPGLISTWNIILMRTSISAMPGELLESASLDGANEIRIYFRIVIPCAKPIFATITLFVAVAFWNEWMSGDIYIRKETLKPIQSIMLNIINNAKATNEMARTMGSVAGQNVSTTMESIKMATIMLTVMPIIAVYPFLQKYFVKGIMIGSLKG